MKIKKEIFLFVIILFAVQCVFSLEISLYKDSYLPRETLQSEIHGNFISLASENIMIYKDDKVHSEPVVQNLIKQNNTYYYYAVLPKEEGNYSLRIEGSRYIESGDLKSDPLIKNFTITKTNESSLSISPGFILTNKDFEVKVKALNKDQTVEAVFENVSTSVFLYEESEETLKFSISGIPTKKSVLKIGNYIIPVFIINTINSSEPLSQLYFSTDSIRATVFPEKTYFFNLYIENTGETNITNINLSNDFGAVLNPTKISNISKGERVQVNFTIITPKTDKKNITGELVASFNNTSVSVEVFLELTINDTKVTLPGLNSTDTLSCINIGKTCMSDEECGGQITPSLEGACCIGTCTKKKTSSSNWIYGVILLIVLAALAGYIFWNYKKKQNLRPKSIDEIMREKVDLKKLNESKARAKKEQDF